MSQARRTLSCWILAGLLERGCDSSAAVRGHHGELPRSVRALSRQELRRMGVPLLKLRILPQDVNSGGRITTG